MCEEEEKGREQLYPDFQGEFEEFRKKKARVEGRSAKVLVREREGRLEVRDCRKLSYLVG